MSVITRLTGLFKKDEQADNAKSEPIVETVEAGVSEQKNENVVAAPEVKPEEDEGAIALKNFKHGKENYIKGKVGVEVFDTRSKRRIGKENGKHNMIRVFLSDRVVMEGYVYLVEAITDEQINLKKIGPVE